MNDAVVNWIASAHDTGISSRTIVAYMERSSPALAAALLQGRSGHPRDPSDLGRCIRLLDIAPEYRARLPEMANLGPEWAALVTHWDELEGLYSTDARALYLRMCDLFAGGVTR